MRQTRGAARASPLVARGVRFSADGAGVHGPAPAARQRLSGAHSAGRQHGDPFPLPLPPAELMDSLTASTRTRVNSAVSSLNQLAASTSNSIRAQGHDVMPAPSARAVTAVQREMLSSVIRRVESYGPPPESFDDEASLKEILASCDQYNMEPKHIAPFDPDKLKILKRDTFSKDARVFLPPAAKSYLTDFRRLIERSEEELELDRDQGLSLRPYWDPRLRSDKKGLIALLVSLEARNLVSFRRVLKARVGLFTVWKKDGSQRLIIDAREANACHRSPPTTRLGGVGSMVDIDLSDAGLRSSGFGGVPEICGNEGDVGDCYYNFSIPELGSWFGVDMPMGVDTLQQHGFTSTTFFDDESGTDLPMQPGELYYPVFSGMCMGWSWGLYIANEAVAHMVATAEGGSPSDALREKQIVPRISPGRPITSTYVDNVSVIGGSQADTDLRMSGISSKADSLSLPFDLTHQQASFVLQSLGLVFHFNERRLRHVPRRVWRLYGASRALLRRQRLSSAALRVWLGHAICVFNLVRPAMSCFSACYRFVALESQGRVPVWNSVRAEIRMALGLFFLAEVNLAAPMCRDVGCGDSSGFGYALLRRQATDAQLRDATEHRERWRFLGVPVDEAGPSLGPAEESFAAGLPAATPARGGVPYGAGLDTGFGKWLASQPAQAGPVKDKWWRKRPKAEIELRGIPTLEECWSKRSEYDLLIAGKWQHEGEHINVKEARVALMDLRRKCRETKHLNHRHLTLSDSMVTIGVFEKGRSHSFALLSLCRRAAAYQIAGEVLWRLRYIETDRNVADAGSRGAETPRSLQKDPRSSPPPVPTAADCCSSERPPSPALPEPPPPSLARVVSVVPTEGPTSLSRGRESVASPAEGPECGGEEVFEDARSEVSYAECESSSSRSEVSCAERESSSSQQVEPAAFIPTVSSVPRAPPGLDLPVSKQVRQAPELPPKPRVEVAPPPPAPPKVARPLKAPRPLSARESFPAKAVAPCIVLEIFSGSARFTRACKREDLQVGLPMDIVFGKVYDLSRRQTQLAVLEVLRSGLVWYTHFGTPCCVWSIARTKVTNLVKAMAKEQLGLEFALFTAECCHVLSDLGRFFSIENPASSRLWSFDPIRSLLDLPSALFVNFTMCAYGRPYKKSTRLLTNFVPLHRLERTCPGLSPTHTHIPLSGSLQVTRGKRSHWVAATAWAGEYPLSLCRLWAKLAREHAPRGALTSHGGGTSPLQAGGRLSLLLDAAQHDGPLRSPPALGQCLPPGRLARRTDIGGQTDKGFCVLAKAYLASGARPPFRLGRSAASPAPPGSRRAA